MTTIYTVTDFLAHSLYSFETKQEAMDYIALYSTTPPMMSMVAHDRKPFHHVARLAKIVEASHAAARF